MKNTLFVYSVFFVYPVYPGEQFPGWLWFHRAGDPDTLQNPSVSELSESYIVFPELFLAVAVQHSLLKELIQMEKDEANMLSRFINYSFESLEPCSSRFVEDNCIKCGNELEFISTLDTILLYKSFLTLTDVLCVWCQYSE